MLKQTSKNFKRDFILEFTKELIRSTDKYKELTIKSKVKKIVKEEPKKEIEGKLPKKEQLKKIIHGKLKEETKRISQLKKEEIPLTKSVEIIKKEFRKKPKYISATKKYPRFFQPLHIPEPLLPETVRHIRPVPTSKEIDLGKLNPLINDPMVKVIECLGPNQKIFVSGLMGRKITPITLEKEEIEEVVEKFSKSSKIPLQAGVVKIAFGNLHLSSIISDITSPKFIIRKMLRLPSASAVSYS